MYKHIKVKKYYPELRELKSLEILKVKQTKVNVKKGKGMRVVPKVSGLNTIQQQ